MEGSKVGYFSITITALIFNIIAIIVMNNNLIIERNLETSFGIILKIITIITIIEITIGWSTIVYIFFKYIFNSELTFTKGIIFGILWAVISYYIGIAAYQNKYFTIYAVTSSIFCIYGVFLIIRKYYN